MASNHDVLKAAAAELGYDRYADPDEGTKYGRWYAAKTGVRYFGTTGVPFCAMFVSYIMDKVGAKAAGIPGAYCPAMLSAAALAHKTVRVADAQPGDIVYFDWNPDAADGVDHVGFVEANRGSYLQTIEGNVGGKVARRTRAYSTVGGVVRPDWTDQQVIDTVEKAVEKRVKMGKDMVRDLQRKLAAEGRYPYGIDGDFGPDTVSGLQRALQSRGYYQGCIIDGEYGPLTHKAYRAAVNAGSF